MLPSKKNTTPAAKGTKRQAIVRDNLEAEIVACAERVFAVCGYEGTSIATIAEGVGLSKQNLLYYFPTKRILYKRVLDDVLDAWLERMSVLADDTLAPQEALRSYIETKLRFSRERPWASRVYGMEVITGAQLYGTEIKEKVVPVLRKDIEIFEKWIAEGKIGPVNATHLLFAIWAMTQSYADFSAQMTLVMDREALSRKDFDEAEKLIIDMVLATISIRPELCDDRAD